MQILLVKVRLIPNKKAQCLQVSLKRKKNPRKTTWNKHLDLNDYVLARDIDHRLIRPPSRYEDGDSVIAYSLSCASTIELDEPRTVADAKNSRHLKK